MAFDLDGLAVLGSMAAKPDAFAGLEAEATKIARSFLTKLLKDKATTLPVARAMASALPDGTLAHVTDGLSDAEVAALAKRLDTKNPALSAADRRVKAALVGDLISGAAEPAQAPAKGVRKAAAPSGGAARTPPSDGVEAAKKVLGSRAMGARKAGKPATA